MRPKGLGGGGGGHFEQKKHKQLPRKVVGCLRHPGASTIGSQLLDGDRSHGWQIPANEPPCRRRKTGTHHTDKTVERNLEGGQGRGDSLQGVPTLRRNANAQKKR